MMNRRIAFVSFVVLTLANCCPAALFAQEPLVWRFAVGDEHAYRLTQRVEMSLDIGKSGAVDSVVEQSLDLVWRVESVDDQGIATLTQQIPVVQIQIKSPGVMDLSYDSTSDEQPTGFAAMLTPMLRVLRSASFTITITPRGEIRAVEVPKKLLDAMRTMPGGDLLGDLATQEGLQRTLQSGMLILPKEPQLESGLRWKTSNEWKLPKLGTLAATTHIRYVGLRNVKGQSMEAFAPTIELRFDKIPEERQVEATRQETTGEILFNRSKGWIESSTVRHQIDLAQTNAGKPMTQRIDQTVELRREVSDK